MAEAAPKISELARAHLESPYLQGLNAAQREAVEHVDGPLLVLAGAGTGKTRVLTTRLAHILATGRARPFEILAVTFTNKAAREMKHRVGGLIGDAVEGMTWLGTFHSIGAQILRRHAEAVGRKPSFTILDTEDQLRLLKQIIQAENIDEKRWPARQLAALIDGWKNRGLTPEKVPQDDRWGFADGRGQALYALYQQRLGVLNSVDFGDLLLLNLKLFQEHKDVLVQFHRRFRYILVDEYQDTNSAQYLWLRLLAQGSDNICCVGDDDQSIYGWRGAEVDNILRFDSDFAGAKVVRLEQNYRSTQHILGAASGLIAANRARLGKTLWTEADGGEKVKVRGVWDGEAEARMVAEDIENWQSRGRKLTHVAVLVRASWQMRAFEDRFITIGMPYRVVGGPRFFERAEIRDAHAYMRLIRQPDDDLAFERIINQPKRGVGVTSLQNIQRAARAAGKSLTDMASILIQTDDIRGKARTALKTFLYDMERWRADAETMKHHELAGKVLDESGYTAMWQADKSPQAAGRLDNLKELINSMSQYDTLEAYLEHVALLTDTEQGEAEDEVWIMTLHAAKGLEYPLVFLPGWEEAVFPSQRSLDENGTAALEEERRLAYVGITRAREEARISFVANRQIFGRWQSVMPSRFIDELPVAHVEVASESGYFGASDAGFEQFSEPVDYGRSSYESPGWRRMQAAKDRAFRPAPTIEGQARLIAAETSLSDFAVGERVFHLKFGYGRVMRIDGSKLSVNFEKAGEKKVIDSFVEKT
jgi:DNA helicase II / ATP-dependent DNA helicase PcrA